MDIVGQGTNPIQISPADITAFLQTFPDEGQKLVNIALMRALRERDAEIATLRNGHKKAEETPVK